MEDIKYFVGDPVVGSLSEPSLIFKVHYSDEDYIKKECSIPVLSINMSSEHHPVNFCEGWYAYTCKEASTVSIKSIYTNVYALEIEDAVIVFGEFGLTDNIEKSVFDKLSRIFEFLLGNKFNYMVRSWNFIPDINSSGSGAMENYRVFCKGRSKAFEKSGIDAIQFPAATGVGSHANNIYGYIWASKSDKCINMENSLQMPAYKYPKQYGPRSPSFARGTIFSYHSEKKDHAGNKLTTFLLSGTASIRNHKTLYPGDILKQVNTTIENITYLISEENFLYNKIKPVKYHLNDFSHFKVYFRNLSEKDKIKKTMIEDWGISESKIFFMHVDICRSDLLVEIEGAIDGFILNL